MIDASTVLTCAGFALAATALYAPARPESPSLPVRAPVPVSALDLSYAPAEEPVRWPELVDQRVHGLDTAARLDLIAALESVDSAWSDAVLAQAAAEERGAVLRDAASAALARGPRVRAAR